MQLTFERTLTSCPTCLHPGPDLMTTSVGNNSVFRSFFEKQKLTGPNFIDWYRQLRLVLSTEDKEYYLEHPIPAAPVAQPGEQIPPQDLAAHAAWVKGQREVAVLMLLTMDLDIQRNLAHLGAYDMLQELKAMFSKQAEQELLQTVREFHTCKQEEGQSVSTHVLKMKGYIDNLERLGQPVGQNLAVSLILVSLNKDFTSFVQNFNMHGMGKTVNELHAMLKLHEESLPKKDANPALHAIRAGRVQKNQKNKPHKAGRGGKGKGKNKMGYAHNNVPFAPKPKTPPPPKKDNPAKDAICHECGEIGHWRRNCPVHLTELHKKKKSPQGASTSVAIFGLGLGLSSLWGIGNMGDLIGVGIKTAISWDLRVNGWQGHWVDGLGGLDCRLNWLGRVSTGGLLLGGGEGCRLVWERDGWRGMYVGGWKGFGASGHGGAGVGVYWGERLEDDGGLLGMRLMVREWTFPSRGVVSLLIWALCLIDFVGGEGRVGGCYGFSRGMYFSVDNLENSEVQQEESLNRWSGEEIWVMRQDWEEGGYVTMFIRLNMKGFEEVFEVGVGDELVMCGDWGGVIFTWGMVVVIGGGWGGGMGGVVVQGCGGRSIWCCSGFDRKIYGGGVSWLVLGEVDRAGVCVGDVRGWRWGFRLLGFGVSGGERIIFICGVRLDDRDWNMVELRIGLLSWDVRVSESLGMGYGDVGVFDDVLGKWVYWYMIGRNMELGRGYDNVRIEMVKSGVIWLLWMEEDREGIMALWDEGGCSNGFKWVGLSGGVGGGVWVSRTVEGGSVGSKFRGTKSKGRRCYEVWGLLSRGGIDGVWLWVRSILWICLSLWGMSGSF
ncbi:zinc finger, CCHC-type containing protein [Tanacetum coccineum]|uniref:Zinc finger, CCHC-type containing protein n=1 Tax=Tanacetum coccineum TaxID=301880 RepID=A0ABQ5EV59_9ASTR